MSSLDKRMSAEGRRASMAWLSAAALVAMVCLAYLPVCAAGFIWDDDYYVTQNMALRSISGLRDIWFRPGAVVQYYPLTFTTFWLEYQAWRDWAPGYHAVNVLLHAFSAVLFWQVLRRLDVPGAWLAAALFALHPVQVESVAWVTERKNVLAGAFYWLALLAWLQSRPCPEDRLLQGIRWKWYVLSLAAYVAALLSKTVTCSLPAVILLIAWWQQGELFRRDWLTMFPFLVLGVLASAMTVWMETEHVGARGHEWGFSAIDRILISGRALAFYVGKLIWPVNLTFNYPRWKIDPAEWWQWLYPLGVIATLLVLWLARKRIGRGPIVAALCFAGTLFPALGFINVYPMIYSFVADHFQYIACAALFTLAATVLVTIRPVQTNPQAYLATVLLLATLGIATWHRAGVYRSQRGLWQDTLQKNPGSWLAHNNLGLLCMQDDLWEAARSHFEQVLPFDPVNAHNNLGSLCTLEGDWDTARSHYQQTLKLQPDHFKAQYNMGLLEAKCGFPEKSIRYFESALKVEPDDAKVHTDLGLALLKLDRVAEARRHFEQAIALEPSSWRAHNGLAMALDRLGQNKEAAFHYGRVIALEPAYLPAQEALRRLTQSPR